MSTACFTGHRPDKVGGYDEDNPIADQVKAWLRQEIANQKAQGVTTFISGMALGVDIWAAEIVLEDPELKLIAALPCKGQDVKWSQEAQERYRSLVSRAHEVYLVAESYSPRVMQARNEYMIDNSQIVIAVWDKSKGGTANCLRYAKAKDRQIVSFDPTCCIV